MKSKRKSKKLVTLEHQALPAVLGGADVPSPVPCLGVGALGYFASGRRPWAAVAGCVAGHTLYAVGEISRRGEVRAPRGPATPAEKPPK